MYLLIIHSEFPVLCIRFKYIVTFIRAMKNTNENMSSCQSIVMVFDIYIFPTFKGSKARKFGLLLQGNTWLEMGPR